MSNKKLIIGDKYVMEESMEDVFFPALLKNDKDTLCCIIPSTIRCDPQILDVIEVSNNSSYSFHTLFLPEVIENYGGLSRFKQLGDGCNEEDFKKYLQIMKEFEQKLNNVITDMKQEMNK